MRVFVAGASALADLEHVAPQAVGSVIGALVAGGLVTPSNDPSAGRNVIVEITDQGRRAIDERAQALTECLDRVLEDDLSPAERARITVVLPLLEPIAEEL